MVRNASQQAARGSVTKRLLCLPVQSIYECQTRGEEQGHCPPRGEADAQTRKLCHAKMRSRAPSKPYVIAAFVFRFHFGLLPLHGALWSTETYYSYVNSE
jgi:hypothetical protein